MILFRAALLQPDKDFPAERRSAPPPFDLPDFFEYGNLHLFMLILGSEHLVFRSKALYLGHFIQWFAFPALVDEAVYAPFFILAHPAIYLLVGYPLLLDHCAVILTFGYAAGDNFNPLVQCDCSSFGHMDPSPLARGPKSFLTFILLHPFPELRRTADTIPPAYFNLASFSSKICFHYCGLLVHTVFIIRMSDRQPGWPHGIIIRGPLLKAGFAYSVFPR